MAVNVPPTVSGSVSPAVLPDTGGTVSVTAEATDGDGTVEEVRAAVTAPDGSVSSVPLAPTGGSTYSGSFTAAANTAGTPVEYAVSVTAVDDAGESASAAAGTVSVAAYVDQAPQVSAAIVTPSAFSRPGFATIRATVSDDRALGEVYASVRAPGGAETRVPLAAIGGAAYEALFVVPANTGTTPLAYAVEVVASDLAGHTARAAAGSITVAPTPPPVVKLKLSDRTLRFGKVQVGGRARPRPRAPQPGREPWWCST